MRVTLLFCCVAVIVSTFFIDIAAGEAAAPPSSASGLAVPFEDFIQNSASIAEDVKDATSNAAKKIGPHVREIVRTLRGHDESPQAKPAPLPYPPRGFIQNMASIADEFTEFDSFRICDMADGGLAFTGWFRKDGKPSAFIWDRHKGLRIIPAPPHATNLLGLHISSDGKTVVGLAQHTERFGEDGRLKLQGAFVWREGERTIFAPDEISNTLGITTVGMSADGRVIAMGRDLLPKIPASYFCYGEGDVTWLVPTTGQQVRGKNDDENDPFSWPYKYNLPPDMKAGEPSNGLFQAISGDGETFVLDEGLGLAVYRVNRTTMKRDVLGMKPFPGWDGPTPFIKSADIPGWNRGNALLFPVPAKYINIKGVSHDGSYVLGTMDLMTTAPGLGMISATRDSFPVVWDAEGNVEFIGQDIQVEPDAGKSITAHSMSADGNTILLSGGGNSYLWRRGQDSIPLEAHLKSYGLDPASVPPDGYKKNTVEAYLMSRDGHCIIGRINGTHILACWGDGLALPPEYIEQKRPQ